MFIYLNKYKQYTCSPIRNASSMRTLTAALGVRESWHVSYENQMGPCVAGSRG